MKYEFFIASRSRNKEVLLDLVQKIRAKNKSVYLFLESETSLKYFGGLEEDAEKLMTKFESTEDWRNSEAVNEIFNADMTALRDSERLVLVLPAGKSAHIEAGVAYGLGKKLILVGEQKEAESLYLIFDEGYPTVDSFVDSI